MYIRAESWKRTTVEDGFEFIIMLMSWARKEYVEGWELFSFKTKQNTTDYVFRIHKSRGRM